MNFGSPTRSKPGGVGSTKSFHSPKRTNSPARHPSNSGAAYAGAGSKSSGSSKFKTKVHHEEVKEAIDRLTRNDPRFRELILTGSAVGDSSLRLLPALANSTYLNSLGFRQTSLTDEGVRSLSRGLLNNGTVTDLDLWGTHLGDGGAIAIAKLIDYNSVIKRLKLAQCGIGDDGARAIGVVLRRNHSIIELKLSQNLFTSKGASEIADAVDANDTITDLSLLSCRIGDDGAIAIAKSLAGNTTLRTLAIWDDLITDAAAEEMAEAIALESCPLTDLTFMSSSITEAGGTKLARALRINHRNHNRKPIPKRGAVKRAVSQKSSYDGGKGLRLGSSSSSRAGTTTYADDDSSDDDNGTKRKGKRYGSSRMDAFSYDSLLGDEFDDDIFDDDEDDEAFDRNGTSGLKNLNLWDDSMGANSSKAMLKASEKDANLYVNVWGTREQYGIPQVPAKDTAVPKARWK